MNKVSQIYGVTSSGGREFLARGGPISDDLIIAITDPARDKYLETALSLDELLRIIRLVVSEKPPRAIRSTALGFLEALRLLEVLANSMAKMMREARELEELRHRAERYKELARYIRELVEEAQRDAEAVKSHAGQAWVNNWSW